MKTKSLLLATALVAALALSGCDRVKEMIGGKPSGQVVAKIDGKEITALELRQEMGNFSSRDPKVMKAAQQQAIQQLILRRLVVEEAKKQKLDKTPDYVLQVRRGEENLLAQLYQRKIAASVAVPTRADAESYVGAHPEKFSDRKILIVDQVLVAPNKVPPERVQALKTLDEVRALYDAEGVQYQTNVATLDTLAVDPRMIAQINKLPPGEIFVVPQRGAFLFNRIADVRSAPFGGDPAVAYALSVLRNQRAQEAVVRQMDVLRKGADKSIVYSEAFKPPAAARTPAAKAAPPTK